MILGRKIYYGWIIVGVIFLIMFIGYAIRDSFPLFYVPILDEFGRSRAETALISSISFLVYGFASAASGALLDKFGPRKTFTGGVLLMVIGLVGSSQATEMWHIFFFWGVVFSLGMSAIGFVPCNALVSRWFERKRATAVGIAQAGGRESFVMSPVTQTLIVTFGWRNTYLAFAAVALITIISLARFLRKSPAEMGLLPDGRTDADIMEDEKPGRQADRFIANKEWAAKDWTLPMAMKTFRFWAFMTTSFTGAIGFGIVMAHEVAFMMDIGFTAMFAAYMLLIFGIVGMIGRLSSFIADIIGRELTFTIGTSGVILGFIMLTLVQGPSSAWMLYVFTVSFGLFSGLTGPTIVTAEVDVFQGNHLGAIIGFINIGFGLGNALGRWFGGYVFDIFGSYQIAFITAIVTTAIGGISLWIASPRKIRVIRNRPRTAVS